MSYITYGTTTIHYCHYKQTRKDVKISFDLVNGVEVFISENIHEEKLSQIMKQKAPWISQKLQELNEVKTAIPQKEFVSG
ncbi:putative metal-dependent hydrolase [Bacillus pakistanensis]|uniref:Metal-dependent hydrolase n=1 Tax=Rossellomorea pakistanensis TaxID=992288 RepID=A0ABS2NHN8_9BACI|nr:hypothetical protein [Bacillus pakistanensis]MBM7587320.1 putative metal-dependent hydrolase [Bacillus pakistanensis]